VEKVLHLLHRGEQIEHRKPVKGVGGLMFAGRSRMSHDHPGHDDRLAAHTERIQRELSLLKENHRVQRTPPAPQTTEPAPAPEDEAEAEAETGAGTPRPARQVVIAASA
jgi:hypothetical protein